MALKGKEYLSQQLEQKRLRVLKRYEYYEMKNGVVYMSKLLPKSYSWMSHTLGWCATAADSMADRLLFNGFREDNFDINSIFNLNNKDILFDSAILSAMIASCSFVYISEDENGFPRLQVIDAANATGCIDPITGLLKEGYAVLERDTEDNPTLTAYFEPGMTTYYSSQFENGYEEYLNGVDYPLLVPIINRPDAKRPFGHSRISRSCMDLTQSALRTMFRSEIASEFYAFPQKYVLGLSEDAEFNKVSATLSNFLAIYKDEDGDKPTVGQFSAASMQPHVEQLKMLAGMFAGETGLTTDDLGFVGVNPSTAEAIKASHENLRLKATKAQRTLGSGFLNVGYLACCLRDKQNYSRAQFYKTECVWAPVFVPDAAALSGIGDGILKMEQAKPGYVTEDKMYNLVGF